MSKKICITLYILTLLFYNGCAWENLPEGDVEAQKIIKVIMKVGGAMNPNLFYYIVFNLSGDSSKKPYSVFDGPDRAKYWHVYYMWGTPPNRETGLYRGTHLEGTDRIDKEPVEWDYLLELLPGTNIEGDNITLRIDLTDLPMPSDRINMNMIVCNQAIDAESKTWYEYDPYVFDSFYDRGISIDLGGIADFWDEAHNQQEDIPNEFEEVSPPEADIINWRLQIISQ